MLNYLFVLSVLSSDPIALDFSWPSKPWVNHYKAQEVFDVLEGHGYHFGEDINREYNEEENEDGNIDFGDPIYCIGDGVVEDIDSGTVPSWGKVVVVRHRLVDGRNVWSIYAHIEDVFVGDGETVFKDQKICTIGNANGVYTAHLHFALMSEGPFPPHVPAYEATLTTENTKNYLIPSLFIASRLGEDAKRFSLPNSWVRVPLQNQAPMVTGYVEVSGGLYSLYQAVKSGKVQIRAKQAGLKWTTIDDPRFIYFPTADDFFRLEVKAKKAGTRLAVFPLNFDESLIEAITKMDMLSAARDLTGELEVRSFRFERMKVLPVSEEVGGVFFSGYLSFLNVRTDDNYIDRIYHFYNNDNPLIRMVSFTYRETIWYQWSTSPYLMH